MSDTPMPTPSLGKLLTASQVPTQTAIAPRLSDSLTGVGVAFALGPAALVRQRVGAIRATLTLAALGCGAALLALFWRVDRHGPTPDRAQLIAPRAGLDAAAGGASTARASAQADNGVRMAVTASHAGLARGTAGAAALGARVGPPSTFVNKSFSANARLQESLLSSRAWLEGASPKLYCVQIGFMDADKRSSIERYLMKALPRVDGALLHLYPSRQGGWARYGLVLGEFTTRAEAMELVNRLQAQRPRAAQLRTVGGIRAEIARFGADDLWL